MMRPSALAPWISVCLVASAGCTLHRQETFGQRLLKGAKPAMEVGPPRAVHHESFESYVRRVRQLAAAAHAPQAEPFAPSVESQSPALRDALLRLSIEPTSANERAVGEAYREAGILDLAQRHLSRAIDLDPTDARAYDGLARIWRDWGFPDLAMPDATRAVFYAPDSAEAQNTLGTLLQALGKRDAARAAYEHAVALDPGAVYALNNLCYLSLMEGRGTAAVGECTSALKIAPNAAPTHNNLGLAYASLGDLQSAHREFSAAGSKARADYNMGIAQLSLGEYAAATASFQSALAADPEMYSARQRSAEARRRAARATSDQSGVEHEQRH